MLKLYNDLQDISKTTKGASRFGFKVIISHLYCFIRSRDTN